MAGTHGVKRPGGSALNAGQVGATRAAEYIANRYGTDEPDELSPQAFDGLSKAAAAVAALGQSPRGTVTPGEALEEIRERMTRFGAHLRSRKGAAGALAAAKTQYARLREEGVALSSASEVPDAVTTLQQCLTQIAMLKAICLMFERGVGSRGSHCILDESGIEMHPGLVDPETDGPYRFLSENEELRKTVLLVSYDEAAGDLFTGRDLPVRPIPTRDIAFEPAWTEYREGKIFEI